MIGKIQITSTGYDPTGPRVYDPTLEPPPAAEINQRPMGTLRPMPELTNEQLAEIEAARLSLAVDEDALQVIDALIAEVRRLRAERLTPEEREVVLGALAGEVINGSIAGQAGRVTAARAARAKIEAARDGGEG